MSVLAVSTFLAALALAAILGVLLSVALLAVDRGRLVPGAIRPVRELLRPVALWLGALVALVATAGSLYFSEVAGFVPCVLCWYQRIAMYPLVVLLGVAAWRSDAGIRRYAVPLAVIGALISLYHIGVERLPDLRSVACALATPCGLIWVERFGFVTIPIMALAGFLAILTLLLVYAASAAEPEPELEQAS